MLISELDGINKKTVNLLKKLKIETTDDLLKHYPRRYEEHPFPIWIADMKAGEKCSIYCRINHRAYEGKKRSYDFEYRRPIRENILQMVPCALYQ